MKFEDDFNFSSIKFLFVKLLSFGLFVFVLLLALWDNSLWIATGSKLKTHFRFIVMLFYFLFVFLTFSQVWSVRCFFCLCGCLCLVLMLVLKWMGDEVGWWCCFMCCFTVKLCPENYLLFFWCCYFVGVG